MVYVLLIRHVKKGCVGHFSMSTSVMSIQWNTTGLHLPHNHQCSQTHWQKNKQKTNKHETLHWALVSYLIILATSTCSLSCCHMIGWLAFGDNEMSVSHWESPSWMYCIRIGHLFLTRLRWYSSNEPNLEVNWIWRGSLLAMARFHLTIYCCLWIKPKDNCGVLWQHRQLHWCCRLRNTNHANASFQHLLQFCFHCLNPSKAAAEEAETFMLSDFGS